MKKFLALTLCALLLFCTACGESKSPETPETPSEPAVPSEPTQPSDPITPAEPTLPSEPAVPSDPASPTDPVDPPSASPTDAEPQTPAAKPLEWSEYSFNGSYGDDAVAKGVDLVTLNLLLPRVPSSADITMFYDNAADNAKSEALMYLDMAKEQYKFMADGSFFVPYSLETDFTVTRNDGTVFSVLRTVYQNTGGAHPTTILRPDNFDAETGAFIIADDLFSVPFAEAAAQIKPLILAQMDAIEAQDEYGVYYENARENLFDLWGQDDFCFTDDAVLFIWQAYSLAPYAMGIQTFSIPYTAIPGLINEKWISR